MILEEIRKTAERLGEPVARVHFPKKMILRPGAAAEAADYAEDAGYGRVLLVADSVTMEAAGRTVRQRLEAKRVAVETTRVKANGVGDVIADEASVVQVMIDIQRTAAEAVFVAGAGTLHDIARYAAFTCGVPFVSVPTAPSVDGFTSVGAPLILRGEKITVPAVGPEAIFADTDILMRAPGAMIAAGFGDMLGKLTSMFDWRFGAAAGVERYSPLAAEVTERALRACIGHAGEIGRRSEEGVAVLMRSLIESGLAILIFGESHPASGAEHHLSHYWETEYLRANRRQLLHGAKVGVACALISELYHRAAAEGLPGLEERLAGHVRATIRDVPEPEAIRALLREAGGPATPEELGVPPRLVAESLRLAHRIRPNRHTLLKKINEDGLLGRKGRA